MQVALVLLYSKWGRQPVNRLGGEGENGGRFSSFLNYWSQNGFQLEGVC